MNTPSFLRRARIAIHAFAEIANWKEVLPLAARGGSVTEIRLRNGSVIQALPEAQLWPHFSDIWYHLSYTKHCPIPQGATVIDIGANVGVFALFAARFASRVLALEPASSNFSLLLKNVAHAENVVPLHCACAAQDGQGMLNLSDDPVSYSLMTKSSTGAQECVELISLESLFLKHKIDRCDFLKLDCEGAEFGIILETAPSVLNRVQRIVMEYHDHLSNRFSHRDLSEKLRGLGFRITEYNPKGTYGMLAAVKY